MDRRVHIEAHPSQLALKNINTDLLLQLFPFALLLDRDMKVCGAGEKIVEAWSINNNKNPKEMLGVLLTDYFRIRRPLGIEFDWDTVLHLTTVLFEMQVLRQTSIETTGESINASIRSRRGSQGLRTILLKGEMKYLKDIDALIFLCSPL